MRGKLLCSALTAALVLPMGIPGAFPPERRVGNSEVSSEASVDSLNVSDNDVISETAGSGRGYTDADNNGVCDNYENCGHYDSEHHNDGHQGGNHRDSGHHNSGHRSGRCR